MLFIVPTTLVGLKCLLCLVTFHNVICFNDVTEIFAQKLVHTKDWTVQTESLLAHFCKKLFAVERIFL